MPNCNKLHPSVITDLDSLKKLDNLWLYSDQPIFADQSMVLQLDNPCSLELVNLQTIRFLDSPTLTIKDADGYDLYVTQPMLMDDTNASAAGVNTVDWRNIVNRPITLADYEVKSTDTLFDSKYVALAGSYANPSWITSLANSKITGLTGWATKAFTNGSTTDVAEGTNLYYTTARGQADATTVLNSQKGVANGVATLDSSTKIPLTQLPASVLGQMNYQGTWNASTNTPAVSATKGYYWVTTVAGTFNSVDYQIGDWIVGNGTGYDKIDNTDSISSWNGRTGAIVPLKSDYSTWFADLSGAYADPAWITSLAWSKITGKPTTLSAFTNDTNFISLGSALTGLSTATNSAITATDSVLTAFGKTQAHLNSIDANWSNYLTTSGAASTYLPLAGGSLNTNAVLTVTKDNTPSTSANTVYNSAPLVVQRATNDTSTTTVAGIGFRNSGAGYNNCALFYLDPSDSNWKYNKGTGVIGKFWTSENFDPTTKSNTAHTHLWSDLTDKPSTFAPSAHTHAQAEITGLETRLTAIDNNWVNYVRVDRASWTRARNYAIISEGEGAGGFVTYFSADADGIRKEHAGLSAGSLTFGYASEVHEYVKYVGTGPGGYVRAGNWRFDTLQVGGVDVSTTAHTHTFASLTSKPTTLAGYGITDAASSSHTHTFASLTSKPTTLAGYGITDAQNTTNGVTGVTVVNASAFTSSFCQDIFGTTSQGYYLREIRTQASAPASLLGNYSSGLAWKGADTYGSLMVAYDNATIRFAGGNGTNPVWTVDLWHSGNFTPSNYSLTSHTHTFASLTSKPTTLSGYGITDAVSSSDSRLTDARTPNNNAALVQGSINNSGAQGKRTYGLGSTSNAINGVLDSGFYDTSATTNPNGSWMHVINSAHNNNYAGNQYQFQIGASFSNSINQSWGPEGYWVRTICGNAQVGAWRKLWHDGNFDANRVTNLETRMTGVDNNWSNYVNKTEMSGTANYLPAFNGTNSLVSSLLYQDATWGIISIKQSPSNGQLGFATSNTANNHAWQFNHNTTSDVFRWGYYNGSGWSSDLFKIDTSGNITAKGSITTGNGSTFNGDIVVGSCVYLNYIRGNCGWDTANGERFIFNGSAYFASSLTVTGSLTRGGYTVWDNGNLVGDQGYNHTHGQYVDKSNNQVIYGEKSFGNTTYFSPGNNLANIVASNTTVGAGWNAIELYRSHDATAVNRKLSFAYHFQDKGYIQRVESNSAYANGITYKLVVGSGGRLQDGYATETNLLTVDGSGNTTIAGTLTVGGSTVWTSSNFSKTNPSFTGAVFTTDYLQAGNYVLGSSAYMGMWSLAGAYAYFGKNGANTNTWATTCGYATDGGGNWISAPNGTNFAVGTNTTALSVGASTTTTSNELYSTNNWVGSALGASDSLGSASRLGVVSSNKLNGWCISYGASGDMQLWDSTSNNWTLRYRFTQLAMKMPIYAVVGSSGVTIAQPLYDGEIRLYRGATGQGTCKLKCRAATEIVRYRTDTGAIVNLANAGATVDVDIQGTTVMLMWAMNGASDGRWTMLC